MTKILLVEDETSLQATIAYNLKKAGYEIATASDGESALELARDQRPDLVLLDVMLPTIDGFDVCRNIRRSSGVPIIILTARNDEIDRVVGLEIGADDYLTKPFSMRELLARVKAILRRRDLLHQDLVKEQGSTAHTLDVGQLSIDLDAYRVTLGQREIALKPKELELLVHLVRHRGAVCPTRQLLGEVWGYDYYGDSRTLAVHIHGLREKLETEPGGSRLIETVRGVGYRFSG
ncbi:MAG: response regulator transcription factor [Nitrolancea sp.]